MSASPCRGCGVEVVEVSLLFHLFWSRITIKESLLKSCDGTLTSALLCTSNVKMSLTHTRAQWQESASTQAGQLRFDSSEAVLVHTQTRARVIYRCLEL